jgi:hypothetical protein
MSCRSVDDDSDVNGAFLKSALLPTPSTSYGATPGKKPTTNTRPGTSHSAFKGGGDSLQELYGYRVPSHIRRAFSANNGTRSN